jgi:hypothetical protein
MLALFAPNPFHPAFYSHSRAGAYSDPRSSSSYYHLDFKFEPKEICSGFDEQYGARWCIWAVGRALKFLPRPFAKTTPV